MSSMKDIKVSIVVRSHNDEQFLEALIASFAAQTRSDFEIIVCDDHSSDNSLAILSKYPHIRLLPAPAGRYIPGKTLNHCIKACQGEFIVFNNSDVIPLDENYLEELIKAFANPHVMATFGNQHSRANASLLLRKDMERAFGDGEISKKWHHFFSLASSAFRSSVFERILFNEEIQYSEDVEWAKRCREQNGLIHYVPTANCEHSHNYSNKELWKRFYNEGIADHQIFDTKISLLICLRQMVMETIRDWIYLLKHRSLKEFFQAPIRRFIQKYSYYCGVNSNAK